jgi:hypothetical protein
MLPFIGIPILATTLAAGGHALPSSSLPDVRTVPFASLHKTYGIVESIGANRLLIMNRYRKTVVVDIHEARASLRIYPGRSVIVYGITDANGIVHAATIWRTFPESNHWPPDR